METSRENHADPGATGLRSFCVDGAPDEKKEWAPGLQHKKYIRFQVSKDLPARPLGAGKVNRSLWEISARVSE